MCDSQQKTADRGGDDSGVDVDLSSIAVVRPREIFALALPALGVLIATPLYLLLDTAVVGRLGAVGLGALGAATTIHATVTRQLTFLSYGTTARSARLFGAGKRKAAVAEGVQASWVAVVVGSLLAIIVICAAPWLTTWLASDDRVAASATLWLRVASLGIPLTLLAMAGNGWLRGVQNTRLPLFFTLAGVIPSACLVPVLVYREGIIGSAQANVLGETITGVCFVVCLVRERCKYVERSAWSENSFAHMMWELWRPRPRIIRSQLVLGRDLIVRSLAFQVSFISATFVAARFGVAALGAHQILIQVWDFLVLALDSLAIAAQTLVGAALGRATVAHARRVGIAVIRYSSIFSIVLACVFLAGYRMIPRLFTTDTSVLAALQNPWWLLVVMILLGGIVFAIDGVLLGASDAAFLRTASLIAAVCGFLPGVWLSLLLNTSLSGVWCGLVLFILIRCVIGIYRFLSMRWARV